MDPIFILDNGAYTIKAGWAHETEPPHVIPNGIFRSQRDKKTYIAGQLDTCQDFGALHYRLPFEKGILTNWDLEKPIWDSVFGSEAFNVDPSSSSLLVTEPCFNLPNVAQHYDQMIFEEYEFASYSRCPGAFFVPYGDLPASDQDVDGAYDEGPLPQCVLVVDSGYSFTHIVPMISGAIQWSAVQRIDIGGKLLTNYLKELVSYRQWNVMDETFVISAAKEACCYASLNFSQDQETCKYQPHSNDIVRHYVLPDYSPESTNRLGYIKDEDHQAETGGHQTNVSPSKRQPGQAPGAGEEQILEMANERFIVPELLFQPSMIGMQQSGLADAIAASIAKLPEDLQGLFWANITVVGGNANIPGLVQRLRHDLRALAPADAFVSVRLPEDPELHIFNCARFHLQLDELPYPDGVNIRSTFVTKEEYKEYGSNITRRKFPSAPVDAKWVPPAAALREGDEIDFDSEGTVSSGHSEELARKRARWTKADEFGKRGKKKKTTADEQGYRISQGTKPRKR